MNILRGLLLIFFLVFLLGIGQYTSIPKTIFSLNNKNYNPFLDELSKKVGRIADTIDFSVNKNTYMPIMVQDNFVRKLYLLKTEATNRERALLFRYEVFTRTKSVQKNRNFNNNRSALNFNNHSDAIDKYYEEKNYTVSELLLPYIKIDSVSSGQGTTSILNFPMTNKIDNNLVENLLEKRPQGLRYENPPDIGIKPTNSSLYQVFLRKALIRYKIPFIPGKLYIDKAKLVEVNQDFTDYLNKTNSTVVKISNINTYFDTLYLAKKKDITLYGSESKNIEEQLSNDSLKFNLFDHAKLAKYHSILNLFGVTKLDTVNFEYNDNTGLLEPLYIHENLGLSKGFINVPQYNNMMFEQEYTSWLAKISSINFTADFWDKNIEQMAVLMAHVHQINPYLFLDKSVFEHNVRVIKSSVNPLTLLETQLKDVTDSGIRLNVKNITDHPITIKNITYKGDKTIALPDKPKVLQGNTVSEVYFKFVPFHENLFVNKKLKITGFQFAKHVFEFSVDCSYGGGKLRKKSSIQPFAYFEKGYASDDLFQQVVNLSKYEFLTVDETAKKITFNTDNVVLQVPLVIPKGYILEANDLKIDIIDGGKIISYSPVVFQGTPSKPIQIGSSDGLGQGLLVLTSSSRSVINHVTFDNLSSPKHGSWNITGAITFYESPVDFDYVKVSNNKCEDGINVVRTDFSMEGMTFENIKSDAFDGDFVKGDISNSQFKNLGNDAIDISGSEINISNVTIINAGDKGLSAGENSKMNGNNISINGSEIAVAGKDLSTVVLKDVDITSCKLGFTAFQKKPEFGPSTIKAINITMKDLEIEHLIEIHSLLHINGRQAKNTNNVKDKMYGVEFGISSEETRK